MDGRLSKQCLSGGQGHLTGGCLSCWDLTSARSLGPMRERHLCRSSTVGASTSRCMPGTSLCHGPACASMLSSRICRADELGIKAAAFMHQLPSCVLAERQDTECSHEGRNRSYALMSLKRQVELTIEVQPLRGSQCSMGSILVTLAPAIVSPEATAVAVARRVVVHCAIASGCIWVLFFTCCPFCWPHAKGPICSCAFLIHHSGRQKRLTIKYIRSSRHHSPIRTLYAAILCFKMHTSSRRRQGVSWYDTHS